MSLTGDMAHGVAGVPPSGSWSAGFAAGHGVGRGARRAGVALARVGSRFTPQKEDASSPGCSWCRWPRGPLVTAYGGVDLAHLLFGSILAVDDTSLILMAAAATMTLVLSR